MAVGLLRRGQLCRGQPVVKLYMHRIVIPDLKIILIKIDADSQTVFINFLHGRRQQKLNIELPAQELLGTGFLARLNKKRQTAN